MKHKQLLLLSALFATSIAHGALSNGGRGGGDDIALEFQQALIASVQESINHPELNKILEENQILSVAAQAKILIVDDALDVHVRDLIQNSVAVNIPTENKILINRQRWKDISDSRLRSAIALHEVLSLKKLEQTGFYPYTTKYLAMLGGSTASLQGSLEVNRLTQIRAIAPKKKPYEVLKQNFEEAQEPIDIMDFPDSDKLKCRDSVSGYSDLVDTIVYRVNVHISGRADDGPLFPETREWRVFFIPRSMERHQSPNRDWSGTTLVKSSTELAQFDGKYQYIYRKNNGLISFKFYNEPNFFYGYCF